MFEWLKLESGERIFNMEQIDFCELSREIVSEWIPQLEQNGIEYEIQIPDQEMNLCMDVSSYRRIINNLLQNLVKHSHADKMILEIHEFEENVCIMLKDNGVGIAEKDLPHICERLYKCDGARSGKGSGLGLAIVSELVKANQGKLVVESKIGEGSSFLVEFSKNK